MKLSQELNDALNSQCTIEIANALKYSQVQSYFEDLQLKNLAGYFKKESSGEIDHFNLFLNYINDRNGGKVTLGEVNAPKTNFLSWEEVADFYVLTEQQTTESIEELYDMALTEKSYIDLPFLAKMLEEQCEEEDSSQKLALNLKMVKDIVLFDATLS